MISVQSVHGVATMLLHSVDIREGSGVEFLMFLVGSVGSQECRVIRSSVGLG